MSIPKIKLAVVSNVFTRMMHFKNAGDTEKGQLHDYDHITLLASGSLKIIVEEQETVFTAPHLIFIHSSKHHELIALEDNTVACCIHGIHSDELCEELIDPLIIPKYRTDTKDTTQ